MTRHPPSTSTDRDEVVTLAARGEGRTQSGAYIPMAAPGDWLDADGVLHHGAHHSPAQCRHYPGCGGCQLQHVDDTAYARWMEDRVAGALAGQGLAVPQVRSAILSAPRTRRRAALKLIATARGAVIGFHQQGSNQIIDVHDCAILHPQLFALLSPLRAFAQAVLPKGSVQVHLTLAEQGVDLLWKGPFGDGLEQLLSVSDFAQDQRLARFAMDRGDGPETLWEPEPATIRLGNLSVPLPHAAFLQPTEDGEAALVRAVAEAVGDATQVDDLFAGLGTFALSLARGGSKVRGVEGNRAAASALAKGAGSAMLPVETVHRDLYRRPMTAAELAETQAVVLDPPRAGAEEQAKELARSNVPAIAYVSCNPASFARDCRLLAQGGYRLDWVQPVGQFRWSTHMELAARLSKVP